MSLNTTINAITLAIAVLTAAAVFGEMRGKVDQHDKDIAQLQIDSRALSITLNKIETSTARIETKLEILLPTSVQREPRK